MGVGAVPRPFFGFCATGYGIFGKSMVYYYYFPEKEGAEYGFSGAKIVQ